MHEKADALLLNIFPRSIAERLKGNERKVVDYVPQATIFFCDIVGFTPLAAQQKPSELVDFLNRIFIGMDKLVERHGLTKIKTIGDAYMASAGVPDPRSDHARAVADFALDVLERIPPLWESEVLPLGLRDRHSQWPGGRGRNR